MRTLLRAVKGGLASVMKTAIVSLPLPLGAKAAAVKWLPMDPWPRSLVYQQCLADRVLEAHGSTAQSGPFKGMSYLRDATEGCLVPKLLGCYEEEIGPSVERLLARGYDRVIDVGCASGYWLTGFALRLPKAEAFGFDINLEARARCATVNALNRVESRVKLLGACTTAELQSLIAGRTLVFMDCDGPEFDLLDPQLAPALRQADIVVECHDYLNPKITPTLLQRFGGSHEIEKISSRRRQPNAEKYPGLRALPRAHWDAALDERRPAVQDWLIMRAKHA